MSGYSLFLQAEQIVAKLMMNMAAVDRRLAEEQSRQAMVSNCRSRLHYNGCGDQVNRRRKM